MAKTAKRIFSTAYSFFAVEANICSPNCGSVRPAAKRFTIQKPSEVTTMIGCGVAIETTE